MHFIALIELKTFLPDSLQDTISHEDDEMLVLLAFQN